MEIYTHLWYGRHHIISRCPFSPYQHRYNAILIKTPEAFFFFFCINCQADSKIHLEMQKTPKKLWSRKKLEEFPLWLSMLWTRLVSVRMWVPSLASLSGFSIRCCCKLCHGSHMWLRSCVSGLWCRSAAAAPISTSSLGRFNP